MVDLHSDAVFLGRSSLTPHPADSDADWALWSGGGRLDTSVSQQKPQGRGNSGCPGGGSCTLPALRGQAHGVLGTILVVASEDKRDILFIKSLPFVSECPLSCPGRVLEKSGERWTGRGSQAPVAILLAMWPQATTEPSGPDSSWKARDDERVWDLVSRWLGRSSQMSCKVTWKQKHHYYYNQITRVLGQMIKCCLTLPFSS